MVTIVVSCRYCGNQDAVRRKGKSTYVNRAYEPAMKEKIVDMTLNSSGIRDTARVLKIHQNNGNEHLEKKRSKS